MNFIQKIIDKQRTAQQNCREEFIFLPKKSSSKDKIGVSLQSDQHYFQIRINELFLKNKRNWYKEYAPMVFVVLEFTYDGKEESVPFVVGPQIMDKFGQSLPEDMVFLNTRVGGLYLF